MPFLLDAVSPLREFVIAVLGTNDPVEIAAVLTGIACVWLAARSNIWNFPVAIVSCGLYIEVFREARLYSDMGLQLAFIGLAAYGWYAWVQRRRAAEPATGPHPEATTEAGVLPISRTSAQLWAVLGGLGLAYALGAGYLLAHHSNAASPYYDSSTTAISLVAQYQLSRRKIENWLLWIGVDVVYVGLYWSRGLALTSLLYVVYLALAAYGYWQWRQEAAIERGLRPSAE